MRRRPAGTPSCNREHLNVRGDCEVRFVKDDKETHVSKFKITVAIDVARGDKTLPQVAAERGAG